MAHFDFAKGTTDDLLQIIPSNETTEWEFKAADVFDKGKFGEFKKQKLGKIVSSFANSGGGFLLLGKQDGTDIFEPVPITEGRTSMEDHLALVISQSVTPHYRNFKIHRIPIVGTLNGSVLVVAFEDSPTAPHQSVADVNYYYRLPGHSIPAPHFHLENLRNRLTRAAVEIEKVDFNVSLPLLLPPPKPSGTTGLCVDVNVLLRNVSAQIADPCAIRVFGTETQTEWDVGTQNRTSLKQGAVVTNNSSPLFPTLAVPFKIHLVSFIPLDGGHTNTAGIMKAWHNLEFCLQSLSQNFAGEPQKYRPAEILGDNPPTIAVIGRQDEEQKLKQSTEALRETLQNSGLGRSLADVVRPK